MYTYVFNCIEKAIYFCDYVHVDVSLSNAKEFTDECIMANNFKHPNVLSIIGVSINPDDNTPLMVMPFMHNGSVQSYVKSKRGNTVNFSSFPKVRALTCS